MKVVQLQKEDRIQRLLTLEILQIDNPDSYFRTVVDSVSYRKLQSNVPKVILKVKFFNLSVFKWKINSWELVLDYNPNDYQVNCKQHPYNIRRQGDRLNTKLESCQPGNCDVELELDNTVAESIWRPAFTSSSDISPSHCPIRSRSGGMLKLSPRFSCLFRRTMDYPTRLS